jgi:hypothetical protein
MQFLLDNILASIIGGTVFMMIVALTIRGYETQLDTTNHYALKQQELNFIEVLRQDLHGVQKVYSVTENPVDSTFTFRTRINPQADTTTAVVKYKRVWMGMRGTTNYYQVQRFVNNAGSGASMLTITDWEIEARNADGEPVADSTLGDTGQIYVRFEAGAPFKEDEIVKLSRWEATFRPPMLRPGEVLL